ncbi:MAG TPA: HD domain-containing protein [Methanosarcinales archaeon]|nr:HD domain-containing protein [Methanosarcinales archaeon]
MNIIACKAVAFAEKAHRGQVRKYTSEPYINHPISVARLVKTVFNDGDSIAAALLHDVVEDTHFTIEDIYNGFGSIIACLVKDLTDTSKPSDGNREARKKIDRQHTSEASPRAKTIKLADIIDNMQSIAKHDPDFAKVYMAEKKALLKVLTEGNPILYKKAFDIITEYYDEVKHV